MWNIILPILLFLTSVFLILLVLIQRGRGGGLAGAFGGMGGQSAFGTKAGDLFTRVTIVTAAFWILLCAFSVKMLNRPSSDILSPTLGGAASQELPAGPAPGPGTGGAAPAGESAPAGTAAPASDAAAPAGEPASADGGSGSAAPAESAPAATPAKSE